MNAFDSFTTEEETSNDNEILGLISGMMDGEIKKFDYKGMRVKRSWSSISVGQGGRLLLTTASIHDVKDWLDEKAKLYGGSQ